jgi:hypothetical protein
VTNTSGSTLSGPLLVALKGLPRDAVLDEQGGNYAGSPFVVLPDGGLDAGASVTVEVGLTVAGRGQLKVTPVLYSGGE